MSRNSKSRYRKLGKFGNALRRRPVALWGIVREQLLFAITKVLCKVLPVPGVVLDEGVRVQRIRSLSAELPDACISLGAGSVIYEDVRLEAYGTGRISVGEGSILGGGRWICRHRIKLGKRVLSSWNVFVQDFDPHPIERRQRRLQVEAMLGLKQSDHDRDPLPDGEEFSWNFPGEAIVVGDDVWIGANVIILKGANIGDGCVIASGSVVLRGNYPPETLIAGNPATVVKSLARSPDNRAVGCGTESHAAANGRSDDRQRQSNAPAITSAVQDAQFLSARVQHAEEG